MSASTGAGEPPRGAGARVAVVTGASRGIGAALAGALQEAGWAVERGSTAVADTTDREAVERWLGEVGERHGRVDLLVNNAGVVDEEVSLPESDPLEWWRTVEVDVLGPYLVTRTAWPWLVAAGGRVVNLSSGAALRAGAEASGYNVAKTALARVTGSTHLAGRDVGVRAFDLAPGVIRTDMTSGMRAHADRTEWTAVEDVVALLLAIADGRLDAWSGRHVRAGSDTVASLEAAADGLADAARTLSLVAYGEDDPVA